MLFFLAELRAGAPDGAFASVDLITVATPTMVESSTSTTTGGTTSGDKPPSPSSTGLPIGAIVGGVGGFVAIAIIVIALWATRWRRNAVILPQFPSKARKMSAIVPQVNNKVVPAAKNDEHGFELAVRPMRNRSPSVEFDGEFDGDDSEALPPPPSSAWSSVTSVTARGFPVTDSEIAEEIESVRGSPFLSTEEIKRRRDECKKMERDCNEITSYGGGWVHSTKMIGHKIGVKSIAQMEETLQNLCVRNELACEKDSGMGGFAKSLADNGRISKLLSDQLHEVAQFRNTLIGHTFGSGKGVKMQPAKTKEFLRLYLDLLNESSATATAAPQPRSSTFRCRLETASDQNLNDVLGAAGDLLLVVDADGFKVISQEVFSDSNQTTVAICAWDFASVEEWEVVPEPTGGESHSFRLVVADPVPLQVQFRTHADIPAQRVEDDIETFVYEQDRAASPIPMAQRVYERGKKVSRKVSLIQESEGTGMTPRNRKMKVLRKVN